MINLLFAISDIYWFIVFAYIFYKAGKQLYRILHSYYLTKVLKREDAPIHNFAFNFKFLVILLFPFMKRTIFGDKTTKK